MLLASPWFLCLYLSWTNRYWYKGSPSNSISYANPHPNRWDTRAVIISPDWQNRPNCSRRINWSLLHSTFRLKKNIDTNINCLFLDVTPCSFVTIYQKFWRRCRMSSMKMEATPSSEIFVCIY
jgi:hypothetical protein